MSLILQRAPLLKRAPAFPIVTGSTTGNSVSDTSSYAIALPTDIQAGELLLAFVAGGGTNSQNVSAPPSGWTTLWINNDLNSGSRLRTFCGFYKTATGSEGSTVTVTTPGNLSWSSNSYRIRGHTGNPQVSSLAQGQSTSPDPPGLTPAGGAKPYLWLAVAACEGTTFSATPANYGSERTGSSGSGTNNTSTRSARRFLRATSEDPAAFTLSGNLPWGARTVAIPGWI